MLVSLVCLRKLGVECINLECIIIVVYYAETAVTSIIRDVECCNLLISWRLTRWQ